MKYHRLFIIVFIFLFSFPAAGHIILHGITKEVSVTARQTGAGQDPWGGYRSAFGMKTMPGNIGDEVQLTVSFEGIRNQDK